MVRPIDKSQKSVYDSFARGIKIGAVAAGARNKNLFTGESAELLKALQTKGTKSKYPGLKLGKTANTARYNGDNRASTGYQYAKLRTKKYLGRGMLDEVKHEICDKLHKSHDTTLSDLLGESRKSLDAMIAPALAMHPLLKGIDAVIKGYLSEIQLNNLGTSNDLDSIMQIIVIQEVKTLIEAIKNNLDNDKTLDSYYIAMSLMNLAVLNVLENSTSRIGAEVYPLSNETPHSQTLTATSSSKALDAVVKANGDTIERDCFGKLRMPGFKLPGVFDTETSGYFDWENGKDPGPDDTYALLGRSAETIYDLSLEQLKQMLNSVEKWVQQEPHPKTLVLDLTIDHTKQGEDDLANTILNSPQIQALINNAQLDIILTKSEQKQTSLGTGKFAAGAACLISGSEERKEKVNQKAEGQYQEGVVDDKDLATFYRKYTREARETFVEAQCFAAKEIKKELDALVEGSTNPDAHKIIANGGFAYMISDDYTEKTVAAYREVVIKDAGDKGLDYLTVQSTQPDLFMQPIPLVKDIPDIKAGGYSFGDMNPSASNWITGDDGKYLVRVDAGVGRALSLYVIPEFIAAAKLSREAQQGPSLTAPCSFLGGIAAANAKKALAEGAEASSKKRDDSNSPKMVK